MKKAENLNEAQKPNLRLGGVSGSVSKRKSEKCFHCESENRNTLKMDARMNGTEEWKCFDCGRWFLV